MARASRGDELAFGLLYDRYAAAMLRYFSRMLHPDTEKAHDMVQDLFIKLMEVPDKYDPALPFSTWLYRIATNMGRNELRNSKNRLRLLDAFYSPETEVHMNTLSQDHARFREEYERLCAALDEEQRLLLTLRFSEELQVKDIAQIMNVPEGTVKSRLFYLLKRFAAELQEFNPQNG